MMPEFSRPVRLDELGEGERTITVRAEPAERDALAQRFALVGIDRLEAELRLRRSDDIVLAEGRMRAEVTQSCVATGDPLPATIDVPFTLRFVPEDSLDEADEVELSEADCDTLTYSGGVVDIGEATAETLALSLEPFPRSPDADAALKAAGVVDETDVGPFAALKSLKDKLEKR